MTSEAAAHQPPHPPLADLVETQVVGAESILLELRDDLPGAVHEARVGVRKLRSTLTIYDALLVPEAAKPLRRGLAWLAGQLGPARDAQVMLARMTTSVAEHGGEGGAELLAHFARDAETAFAAAREALESDRFAALIARLDVARLRTLVTPGAETRDLAVRDLQRLVRDLETSSGASDSHLHDLRKAVKRARYVRGGHDDVDTALKRIQAVLGEHQDSVVARARLATLPASALVDDLVAREERVASRSETDLRRAVGELHEVLASADA